MVTDIYYYIITFPGTPSGLENARRWGVRGRVIGSKDSACFSEAGSQGRRPREQSVIRQLLWALAAFLW